MVAMSTDSKIKTLDEAACVFPESLADALKLLADGSSRGVVLAGGTDLMVQWVSGLRPIPDRVVSVFGLDELRGITDEGDHIVIGAAETHAAIQAAPLVQEHLPALAAAAAVIGGPQIQSRGTIGGNVANASPAGDLPPAMMVTDGSVVVASTRGERAIPLPSFFKDYKKVALAPDELIVRFVLPKKPKGAYEFFKKIGPREAQAISKVVGACRISLDPKNQMIMTAAMAFGSVAPTVVRLYELESWLEGQILDEAVVDEAEQHARIEIHPIDDIRSTAEYRKWLVGRMVRDFLEQLLKT
jgi:CO/xanthine dehydrogenase FAD-binding subunit